METQDLELSRIDYLILGSLKTNKATNPMLGLTIKEMGIEEVKELSVRRHLNKMIDHKLVCQSGKFKQQKMYYITEQGLNVLKEGGNINV